MFCETPTNSEYGVGHSVPFLFSPYTNIVFWIFSEFLFVFFPLRKKLRLSRRHNLNEKRILLKKKVRENVLTSKRTKKMEETRKIC